MAVRNNINFAGFKLAINLIDNAYASVAVEAFEESIKKQIVPVLADMWNRYDAKQSQVAEKLASFLDCSDEVHAEWDKKEAEAKAERKRWAEEAAARKAAEAVKPSLGEECIHAIRETDQSPDPAKLPVDF